MAEGYEALAAEVEHAMAAKAKRLPPPPEGQVDGVVVLLPVRLSSVA